VRESVAFVVAELMDAEVSAQIGAELGEVAPDERVTYVCGVSTRRVDSLVESLGLHISKSEVSRIAAGLDEQVQAFRERPLEGRYPYLFVDAKSRRSETAAACGASASSSPTACTSPGGERSSALTSARPRPRASGASSCAPWSCAASLEGRLAVSDAAPALKVALAQVLGAPGRGRLRLDRWPRGSA
jgi:hypothetical protein